MYTDVSIHFTVKGQTVSEINQKLDDWFNHIEGDLPFDFSETTEPVSALHHCFLPEKTVKEKGLSNEIYEDILHPFSERKVCWFGVSDYGSAHDRLYMLQNLQKLNGIALFIGEIKEGVKEEYDLCIELGIQTILIP